MKTVTREDWTKALRSGEFEQGAGAYKTVDGGKTTFCCLGVLCEIAGVEWFTADLGPRGTNYTLKDGFSPVSIREELRELGLLDMVGIEGREVSTLIIMNDTTQAPFSVIADYVDALP